MAVGVELVGFVSDPAGEGGPPRRGWLLRLTDGEGRWGQGEACPLPGYSPDTAEDVEAVLRRVAAEGIPFPGAVDETMEHLRGVLDPIRKRSPSAAFALETAALDLLGRRVGRPIVELLAGPDRLHPVAVNALIPVTDEEGALSAVRKAVARGIRTFKFKIGAADFEGVRRILGRVRTEAGSSARIRLDANGAWDPRTAARRLERLAEYDPEYVEEPVPAGFLSGFRESPVPLAADESLRDPLEGERIFENPVCTVFVLKPMLLGGSLAAMDWVRRVRGAGRRVVITHLFDGPVGVSAATHLACAAASEDLACGLDDHPGLEGWTTRRSPEIRNGILPVPDRPGLGMAPVRRGR